MESSTKLRVLVIEDLAVHQESARQTIDQERYTLTIATGIEEAMKVLGCINRNGRFCGPDGPAAFDVVLTDMFLPRSPICLADKDVRGKEEAYGFPIVLQALLMGVRWVAVVSDMDHHASAMASIADGFYGMREIGTQKFLRYDCYPSTMVDVRTEDGLEGEGKNWGEALALLLA